MFTWDVSPEIVSIGPITIRWYGLLFATSFIIGFQIMTNIYKKEKINPDFVNDLILYMIFGTIIGARLGHCLFYNPDYYLSHPFEILQVWKGGLASHGAAIGIVTSIYIYTQKKKYKPFLWMMDRVVITVALAAFFIRIGNFFNSEIIGKPTDVPWAVKFKLVDDVYRHPTQLYEAFSYILIFFFLFRLYQKHYKKLLDGYIFGLFLTLIFSSRFIIEFFKKEQEYFEIGMLFNMGQLLSIPLIIIGIIMVYKYSSVKIINKTNVE